MHLNKHQKPKLIVLGATAFSHNLLNALKEDGQNIQAVFGIPKEFTISYSDTPVTNYNYADLNSWCEGQNIPFYEVGGGDSSKLSHYASDIAKTNPDIILALGWYYKIPKEILQLPRLGAWGIHASQLPDYAGGAPLVWAMIEGQEQSGVTLFRMTEDTDAGDIIAQKTFCIEKNETINTVLQKATKASQDILLNTLNNLGVLSFTQQSKAPKFYPQRSPEDGLIDTTQTATELHNFIRAQSNPYPGAFLVCGDGKRLVIEQARIDDDPKREQHQKQLEEKFHIKDFTLNHYQELLKLIKESYQTLTYQQAIKEQAGLILRHDVDLSLNRAVKMAKLESQAGLQSTYFVQLNSEYYNLFEKQSKDHLQILIQEGHHIGLHFDALAYNITTHSELTKKIHFEKQLLEELIENPLAALSFHNPTDQNIDITTQDELCGLINTYGPTITEHYTYISDSNGLWKQQRLITALENTNTNWHVLLHPGWWQDKPMSPRTRLQRCVYGRGSKILKDYDARLKKYQRPNIKG